MKNLFYLFLLLILIPINIKAETYYTEYEPYLLNQSERIETNDLIKEESIENYYINKEVKINTGYYPDNTHLVDKPYVDYSDKIIVSKREWFYQQTNYTKGLLYSTDEGEVNTFYIDDISHLPKFTLYDTNYNKIDYIIDNNLITMNQTIAIKDLLILMEIDNDCQFTIRFTNGFIFNVSLLKYVRPYYELNFVLKSEMKTRLSSMGVYTSAIFPVFEFHIYYTYHYLYYDKGYVEELSFDPTAIYVRKEFSYNYYKRDRFIINDYLLLDEDKDILKIIESTTVPLEDIQIEENIDYEKNGVYEIKISYKDITVSRLIIIINEVEPITIYQEKIIETHCEPIIIEKPNLKEIFIAKPFLSNKPQIVTKYRYLKEKCNCPIKVEDKISKEKDNFKYAYLLPIIPFISGLVVLKKRNKT